jgi:hypothetical protein
VWENKGEGKGVRHKGGKEGRVEDGERERKRVRVGKGWGKGEVKGGKG